MKITVFTSNQPRHIGLINRLAEVSDMTFAVMECTTVFPGLVQDFYNKTEIMQKYFSNVIAAEKKFFGDINFTRPNVRSLSLKSDDLAFTQEVQLHEALQSDLYVVFGASFIKGWLVDFLIGKKALNIHIGVSPYYRGSSCNFWALYDFKPEYVGATIHLLSKGLDSGPILYHSLPKFTDDNPFEFTMRAVEVAQKSLVEQISNTNIHRFEPQVQNKKLEIRYSRHADFNDEVAAEFLKRSWSSQDLGRLLDKASRPELINPLLG